MRHTVNTIVFLCMLACFAASVTLFPADTRTTGRENRALNAFPEFSAETVLSGEFSAGMEPFLSDRVGFRAALIDAAQMLDRLGGFSPGGVRVTNNTLVPPNRLVEIFSSSAWVETTYAEALVAYREALPDDTRVLSMLVPAPIEFLEPGYNSVSDSERETIDRVYGILNDAGIVTVDVYSELQAHFDEPVYFNSDHHWTMLGAYYGYLKFAGAAGFEPVNIADCAEGQVGGFIGFLNSREPSPAV